MPEHHLVAESLDSGRLVALDRKSTRLNSSHRCISYAVFCLKKKITPRAGEKLRGQTPWSLLTCGDSTRPAQPLPADVPRALVRAMCDLSFRELLFFLMTR